MKLCGTVTMKNKRSAALQAGEEAGALSKSSDKKALLSNTLLQMIDAVPLDQVTVSSLTRECGLSRQTFYYHFSTLDDLFAWTLHQEMMRVVKPVRAESAQTQIKVVLERIYQKRALMEKIARYSATSRNFDELLKQEVGIYIMRFVEDASVGLDIAPQDRALIARFYTAGLLEIIRIWIEDGMGESPERLTERLGLFLVNSSDLFAKFNKEYRA